MAGDSKAQPDSEDGVKTIEGRGSDPTVATFPPFVEVEVVYETDHGGLSRAGWHAFEVWTRNSIYAMDWQFRCVAVVDRDSGERVAHHTFEGATLTGSQQRLERSTEVSYPLPRPGHEAVFEGPAKRFMTTSVVEHVVLRLRAMTVPHDTVSTAWERITER